MKLNLGSGSKRVDGYINVDFRDIPNVDIVDDIETLKEVKDDSCEALLAEHVFEHFPYFKFPYVLRQWWRVLKDGGELRIVTPNMKWMVSELNRYYLTVEDKFFDPRFTEGCDAHRRTLMNFVFGGQEYFGNYHYTVHDIPSLCSILVKNGFQIESTSDPGQQNISVVARKVKVNMDQYKTIVVGSVAQAFGDRLMSYPIATVFKYFYPDKNVLLLIDKKDVKLFKNAANIDGITTDLSEHNNPETLIVYKSFDVDHKWTPWVYGINDRPDDWYKMIKEHKGPYFSVKEADSKVVDKKLVDAGIDGHRPTVAVFIDTHRDRMSLPYNISGYGLDNYRMLFENMPDIDFVLFQGPGDTTAPIDSVVESCNNVVNLGVLDAYDQICLYRNIKILLLISISTSVSAMICPMAGVDLPQITLHSTDTEGNSVWAGIPDQCVLPPARFRYLFKKGNSTTFLKPFANSSRSVHWVFPHYWTGVNKDRSMVPVNDTDMMHLKLTVETMLDQDKAFETGISNHFCEHCSLLQDMGICIYDGGQITKHWRDHV